MLGDRSGTGLVHFILFLGPGLCTRAVLLLLYRVSKTKTKDPGPVYRAFLRDEIAKATATQHRRFQEEVSRKFQSLFSATVCRSNSVYKVGEPEYREHMTGNSKGKRTKSELVAEEAARDHGSIAFSCF